MQALFSIFMALVTLGILVTIHEFGHYWVARRCGVHVLRFAVGFGRPLLAHTGRNGTEFTLCAIPLGGYVKMLDERDAESGITDENRAQSFNAQPVRNKLAIVAAGPAANFALAILVLFALFLRGETGLAPIIESVEVGSVAAEAGLKVGQEINSWQHCAFRQNRNRPKYQFAEYLYHPLCMKYYLPSFPTIYKES